MTEPIIERRVASSRCPLFSQDEMCGGEVEVRVSGGWACTKCHVLRELNAPTPESKVEPAHYGGAANPFEAIKIIEHLGWGPGFCKGNALKYLMRAGKKDGESEADDLRKSRWYIDRAIAGLESK